jgi:hypothetical protein
VKASKLNIDSKASTVCASEVCKQRLWQSCGKVLPCGHFCLGIRKEENCLPCLDPECVQKTNASNQVFFLILDLKM